MSERSRERPAWALIAGPVALVFGALTVFSGGRVLFGPEAARLAAGNYVSFVLRFNFLAGFAYIAGGAFELRTVLAMTLRTAFWAAIADLALRAQSR